MASKILTGAYAGGYVLSPAYSGVTLKASADVGGYGLRLFTLGSVVNAGTIRGETGPPGYDGARGIYMRYGSHLKNSGVIYGGAGHEGAAGASPGPGFTGGEGIFVAGYGGAATVITNTNFIAGGFGGAGGNVTSGTAGSGGAGGSGAAGVLIEGDEAAASTVTNTFLIEGGAGGGGGYGGTSGLAGMGGNGGAGVVIEGAGKVIQSSIGIYGGAGGRAGGNEMGTEAVAGGRGGAGVWLPGGASLTVSQGYVDGGQGGIGYGPGGAGGYGVYVDGGNVTVSGGGLYGGDGGDGGLTHGAGGVGAAAALLQGAGDRLTQSGGRIIGGNGGSGGEAADSKSGHGGAGGAGVTSLGVATVSQTSGSITGGSGGDYHGGAGGRGGTGVYLAAGGRLTSAGLIEGGGGGAGYYGGNGGAGVVVRDAGTVVNTGSIIGGAGGSADVFDGYGGYGVVLSGRGGSITNGSSSMSTALIEGACGIYLTSNSTTVTNFGTIEATSGVSVSMGVGAGAASGRMIGEIGSTCIGEMNGGGATLELAGGTGAIYSLGNNGSVTGAMSMYFREFGTYQLDAGGAWTLTGFTTLSAGQTLLDNAKVNDTGMLALFGTVAGSGSFTISGSTAVINTGAKLTVSTWSEAGGTTDVDEALSYAGTFSEGAGATTTLGAGDKLTLSGPSTLAGLMNGSGTVATANTTLKALTIGGSDTLDLTGTATQTAKVSVGDASASAATLSIAKGATMTVTTASDIDQGAAAGSSLKVLGTLIRSGATGATVVQLATTDSGLIEANAGTLDFTNALGGKGALTIGMGAILEVDTTAASTLAVSFAGANAVLALKAPITFGASIAAFTPTDEIDLLKIKATSATLGAGDTLVIVQGSTAVATLQLAGTYTGDTFGVVSDGHGGSFITISTGASHPPAEAAPTSTHQFVAAISALGAAGVATSPRSDCGWHTQPPTLFAPRSQLG